MKNLLNCLPIELAFLLWGRVSLVIMQVKKQQTYSAPGGTFMLQNKRPTGLKGNLSQENEVKSNLHTHV